ncbi:hypothetical protein QYE76_031301 [Lolium multiflorum]|uniref:Arabidopsis retrotransposon Orf1 C-terminal domain-containing protein n=1 Tax=Lolium multiflorum TaxID=4521 RepID=A0AAD8QRE2_LOLMU|nr:hypothetical protein QYE76_031301 [Lolium multiflorum]
MGLAAARKKRKMNNYNFGEVFEGETTSTGRPSRASTRIRRSYNEDVIAPSFDEGNGDPNASSFPCYEFLSNAGLLDDFLTLIGKAGLTTYMEDERKQYYMLTKIFVESFKFNNKHFNPTVAFKIYGTPVTMKLKDFCAALGIAPAGTAKKIEDNPRVLLELYREITNDDCRTIQRGKIRNIQLPAIKYFAYYLATSILGRENTSNISSYHLAFLIAALTGETPYHLGSVIARRLSNKGPIYGGIIASRILARLDLPLDPNDVEIPPVKLDIAAMKSHQFVTVDSSMDNIVYRMLFADGDEREVLLPQTDLFSIGRKPWSRSKEEVDEQLKIQGFHQQHDSEDAEPSYDYTVTNPTFRKNLGIYTEGPIFPEDSRSQKGKSGGGPRAPHHRAARPRRGRAALVCGGLGWPPTPSFGLLIALDLKTHGEKSKSPETLQRAATSRNSVSGARSLRSGSPPDGELEEIFTAITTDVSPSTSHVSPIHMDGREGEKKRLLQETGFSSGTCAVPDEKKHRVEEVSQFDGRFEDESQFDAPVDGTDDEPFIDEGPAPEIIQPTEGGRGPSTQLCVEVDARPEIITGVRVVSRPPSPDAPVDGTDDEPLIDEGPAPEIIQPTEGGRGPSTQLCVEEDAHPEIIRGVPVVSGPPSPDAKC